MEEVNKTLSSRRVAGWLDREPEDWLHVLTTVDSTNDYAKALAEQGAPAGTVVLAERQTAGRGRLGRTFQSPPGQGIYFSLLLRPQCPVRELMNLTCLVAVAVCEAVEKTLNFRPGIKWINDLVWDGRKLAGILTELSLVPGSDAARYCIVGIGINCAQRREDFDPEIRDMAVSLETILGRPVDRERLVAQMIRELEGMDALTPARRRQIMTRYRQDCVTIGKTVQVQQAGERRQGMALDVDDDGALLVDFGQGVEAVQSGEASVRGMYGYAE